MLAILVGPTMIGGLQQESQQQVLLQHELLQQVLLQHELQEQGSQQLQGGFS